MLSDTEQKTLAFLRECLEEYQAKMAAIAPMIAGLETGKFGRVPDGSAGIGRPGKLAAASEIEDAPPDAPAKRRPGRPRKVLDLNGVIGDAAPRPRRSSPMNVCSPGSVVRNFGDDDED
jgi:hypothetical protein